MKRLGAAYCIGLLLLVSPNVFGGDIGTAFTYQGFLKQNGDPVSGDGDIHFLLYDAAVGGKLIAEAWDFILVEDGVFTSRVDFGPSAFDGTPRWLAIEVAVPKGDPLVPLSGRQAILPAPYALYAASGAGGSGESLWDEHGNAIYYNDGPVGIGTSSPSTDYKLHVTNNYGWAVAGENAAEGQVGYLGTEYGGVMGTGWVGVYGSSEETGGWGVFGEATSTSGATRGVYAEARSDQGRALYANNTAHSGDAVAVYGRSASTTGFGGYFEGRGYFSGNVGIKTTPGSSALTVNGFIESTEGGIMFPDGTIQESAASGGGDSFWEATANGIRYNDGNVGLGTVTNPAYPLHVSQSSTSPIVGINNASTTSGTGILSESSGQTGSGIIGRANSTTGENRGVYGISFSSQGHGVRGHNSATTGVAYGVSGQTSSTSGIGVYGYASATSGTTFGVYGKTRSSAGFAGYFDGQGFFSDRVGIGTESPQTDLDVNGLIRTSGFRLTDTPVAGYVLTCDASGNGTWQEPTGGESFSLPYEGTASGSGPAFQANNWGTGAGIKGAGNGVGVEGYSAFGIGVLARGNSTGTAEPALRVENTNDAGIAVFSTTESSDANTVFVNKGTGDLIRGFSGPTGGDMVFRVENDGKTSVGVLRITGGSDLSEQFDVEGSEPEPGMVVCIDTENPGKLRLACAAYDRTVAGIVSGAGGVNTGMQMGHAGSIADGQYPIALTGRVYVWVDTANGPIQPGDLLTTADTPGHAMKVTDHARAQGAILGKAMTGLDEGRGLVLVLVSLQ